MDILSIFFPDHYYHQEKNNVYLNFKFNFNIPCTKLDANPLNFKCSTKSESGVVDVEFLSHPPSLDLTVQQRDIWREANGPL